MTGSWVLTTNKSNILSATSILDLSEVKALASTHGSLRGIAFYRNSLVNHTVASIDGNPTSLLLVGDNGFEVPYLLDEDGDEINLYRYFCDKATTVVETTHEGIGYFGRRFDKFIVGDKPRPTAKIFILNWTLCEYMDISYLKEDFNGVHPLPLLIANPEDNNDAGGNWVGDRGCVDAHEVGRWAGHLISSASEFPTEEHWKRITCFQVNNKEGVSRRRKRDDIYTLPLAKRRRSSERLILKKAIEISKKDY